LHLFLGRSLGRNLQRIKRGREGGKEEAIREVARYGGNKERERTSINCPLLLSPKRALPRNAWRVLGPRRTEEEGGAWMKSGWKRVSEEMTKRGKMRSRPPFPLLFVRTSFMSPSVPSSIFSSSPPLGACSIISYCGKLLHWAWKKEGWREGGMEI